MHAADTAAIKHAVTYADQWLAYRRELRDIPGLVVAVRRDQESFLSKGTASLVRAIDRSITRAA